VDDLVLCSPHPDKTWAAIAGVLSITPPEEVSRILGVDVTYKDVSVESIKYTHVTFAMTDFSHAAVKKFMSHPKAPGKLKEAFTPYLEVPPSRFVALKESDVGVYSDMAASYVMSLMYMGRMSRPDILWTVNELASHLKRWSSISDDKLVRLMEYVNSTAMMGSHGMVAINPQQAFRLEVWADADLAGSDVTSRSTSGFTTFICGAGDSRLALAWSCKRQTSTALSTAESEVVSMSSALCTQLLPLEYAVELIMNSSISSSAFEDNAAALITMGQGYSTALRHLPKHQRVSLGFCGETFSASHRQLLKVESKEQRADGLTKGLSRADMVLCRLQLCVDYVVAKMADVMQMMKPQQAQSG